VNVKEIAISIPRRISPTSLFLFLARTHSSTFLHLFQQRKCGIQKEKELVYKTQGRERERDLNPDDTG
jgi:hypothetical protein